LKTLNEPYDWLKCIFYIFNRSVEHVPEDEHDWARATLSLRGSDLACFEKIVDQIGKHYFSRVKKCIIITPSISFTTLQSHCDVTLQ
jgi:hypothetical protein